LILRLGWVVLGASLIAMDGTAQIKSSVGGIEVFNVENVGCPPNRSSLLPIFHF
jgi:hypothetical protein